MNDTLEIGCKPATRAQLIVTGVITGAMFGAISLFAVLRFVLRQTMTEIFPWLLPGAIVGVLVGVVGFWWQSTYRAVVTPTTLELHRGGRLWQSFPRATTQFTVKITTAQGYGSRVNASRELVVTNAAGQASYALPGVSKDDFYLLLNTLNPETLEESLVDPSLRDQPVPTITYPIDTKAAGRAFRTLRIMLLVLIVALAAGTLWLLTVIPTGGSDYGPLVLTITIVGLAFVLIMVWPLVRVQKSLRRLPSHFTVSAQGLAVDDTFYDFATVSRIDLMQPDNTINFFEIGITMPAGRTEYWLGNASTSERVFPNYLPFMRHLAHANLHRPGTLQIRLP